MVGGLPNPCARTKTPRCRCARAWRRFTRLAGSLAKAATPGIPRSRPAGRFRGRAAISPPGPLTGAAGRLR